MQLNKLFLAISILTITGQGCIKRVNVVTRNEEPILVVEGSITTDTVPYTVKLTYSGLIDFSDDIPDQYLEKEATVSISDDLGNVAPLVYKNKGIYETTDPAYIGKVGRSYHVIVLLKNGKKYISTPEKIKPPIPFSKVNASFVNIFNLDLPTYLNVSIDANDPAGEENYYRWSFYSYIMRQTKGVPCGFGCIQFEYCYQKFIDKEIRILSDAAINGKEIRNQSVGRCYIYTFGNPYIEISQLTTTREAYQFWKRYQEQLTRTGGILDPLPAAIKGNVYNASNTSDFALGYFSASSVTSKRVVLVPYSITNYLLEISAFHFIPEDYIACFDYYPNSLVYPVPGRIYPPPTGWENAEELKVYW
ncbi:MAG: DUF4249 domain-containing protein [Chitinophagaceae bacterium]